MIKYQYQIIRYMHDQFTGEFVNVGVVLYAPEKKFLQAKILKRYSRISQFFGGIKGDFLIAALKRFENLIQESSEKLKEFSSTKKSVDEFTAAILIKDDSALQMSSDIYYGVDLDPNIALLDIFDRMVEKYYPDEIISKQTDQYVWRNLYKRYFDEQGITKQLKKQSFTTEKDTIAFEKSWKNGVWNCYQPLSLDLQSEDSIKGKVYKWFGILKQLETAEEAIHVYFLTSSPKEHSELKPFIDEMLGLNIDDKLKVDLVEESEAEVFVSNVRDQMEASGKLFRPGTDDLPF